MTAILQPRVRPAELDRVPAARELPGWLVAVLVFAASRLIVAVATVWSGRFHWGSSILPQGHGFWQWSAHWDGVWYRIIALQGYPDHLPLAGDGQVARSPWAFYPLFPYLTRPLTWLGLRWEVAGVLIAVLCGAAAFAVIHLLVSELAGRELATWTCVLLAAWPAAPVLGFTYSESPALLFVSLTLYALHRRWYWLAAPAVLLAGFSRALGAPLLGLALLHAGIRIRRAFRGDEQLSAWGGAGLFGLLLAGVLATAGWPVVAALRLHDAHALTDAQSAWRLPRQMSYLKPWLLGMYEAFGWFGPVLLLALLLGLAWWVLRPASLAMLGPDLAGWCLLYVCYLLVFTDAITSMIRFFLLLWPLALLLAGLSTSRAYRLTLAVAFAAGQLFWLNMIWFYNATGHMPP